MATDQDAARRREADAALRNAGGDAALGRSALARAAQRTADHFAATDAGAEAPADAAELWGRRIGRALGAVALVGLAVYLWLTYGG